MPKTSGIYIGGGREKAKAFGKRTSKASPLSAEEWADVPLAVRENAFWSAKLVHAKHVSDLKAACKDALKGGRRRVRDLHSSKWTASELEQEVDPETGKVSPGSGVKRGDIEVQMTRDMMVREMRFRAHERGLTPDGPRDIENIASAPRIRLIHDMAVDSTRERVRFEEGADRDTLFAYPAQRLIREEFRRVPRDWGERWAQAAAEVAGEGVATNGEWVARKDSPIWTALSAFGRPYPPFDYGSGMGVEDVDRDEAVALGLVEPQEEISNPVEQYQQDLEASTMQMGEAEKEWLRSVLEAEGGTVTETPDGMMHWSGIHGGKLDIDGESVKSAVMDKLYAKKAKLAAKKAAAEEAKAKAEAEAKAKADAEKARLVELLKKEQEKKVAEEAKKA